MNYEIVEALGQIAREKNVDKKLVIETLEAGLQSAARKKYGATANFGSSSTRSRAISASSRSARSSTKCSTPRARSIFARRTKRIPTPASATTWFERPFDGVRPQRDQAAKQVVVQRVREAEREMVYADYHKSRRRDRHRHRAAGRSRQLFVNLGRTEALLPVREQISRERYRQGEHAARRPSRRAEERQGSAGDPLPYAPRCS